MGSFLKLPQISHRRTTVQVNIATVRRSVTDTSAAAVATADAIAILVAFGEAEDESSSRDSGLVPAVMLDGPQRLRHPAARRRSALQDLH
ncbi:MAG: hypothetical protein DMG69_05675 [Acidobacteria bacterium]|nr:MAG: hypothetical protein DMG69_05675 [Acidobacteriota bacterium]